MAKKLKIDTCLDCKHSKLRENTISSHELICYHPEVGGRQITDDTMKFMAGIDFPDWCPLKEWD